MHHRLQLIAASLAVISLHLPVSQAETPVYELDELTVSPQSGQSRLPDPSTSATVLDLADLSAGGGDHLQETLRLAPNLGWAGGVSRPRYFQMRGIGERSHFARSGPPNFSVGFLVDDMDFSGMGMHASLFDVQSVEILHGPQAAIYGSRALAGLISIETRQPSTVDDWTVEYGVGTDRYRRFATAGGGPITRQRPELLSLRVAVEQLSSDGFRRNTYLNRDDTNQRDEFTGRLKLLWQPSPQWRWDVTGLFANHDNGYDVWTPDNNGFRTYTDRPGKDSQKSYGTSIRGSWFGPEAFRLVSISTYVQSDAEHSYDADWANHDYWAAPPYNWDTEAEGYAYDFFEILDRTRRTVSQDFRLISEPGGEIFGGRSAWHAGIYASRLSEKDDYEGFSFLKSDYQATSGALYGQLSTRLAPRLVLRSSARVENRRTEYDDDKGVAFDDRETMWGGRLALEAKVTDQVLVFGAASRGFKGGGVNQRPALPEDKRSYDSETLWNFETGVSGRFLNDSLKAGLRLFYMLREDLQIRTSSQADPMDPTSFAYYTGNAAKGYNRGAEIDLEQRLLERLRLFAVIGLLDTAFENYESAGGDVHDIDGRDQPYAPNYTFTVGAQYDHGGFFARAEVEGRDRYYFSDSHDQRSEAYELLHLRAGYGRNHWTLSLWGRNVLDKKYATRGFYFGQTPPEFEETLWLAYGDRAQFGATLALAF